MRLGFIGPCRGDLAALRPLAEVLLFELGVARAIYLGADDALERSVRGWPERLGAPKDEAAFLTEAALLALDAPADAIDALLERDARLQRLGDLAGLPPPPMRAVEMFEDRVVLMVHDKSVLDEDDVANATAIVWGHSGTAELRPIGPRVFLSPGFAALGQVAVIDLVDDGIICSLHDKTGRLRRDHTMSTARGAKVGVQ